MDGYTGTIIFLKWWESFRTAQQEFILLWSVIITLSSLLRLACAGAISVLESNRIRGRESLRKTPLASASLICQAPDAECLTKLGELQNQ
jgi:hypothetical protein